MNSWGKFRRLSWRERKLLCQALLLLPLSSLALCRMSLRRWQSILARLAPAGKSSDECHPERLTRQAQSTARMVRAGAAHGIYSANCLSQSLVLWCLLRRQGIKGELKFGARKGAEPFEAHAWVEVASMTLNEACERFAPFESGIVAEGGKQF